MSTLPACGVIQVGGATAAAHSAPRPVGAPLYQGQFFGQSGQQASGTASIFFTNQSQYVLRLEGLSVPVESGLKIKIYSHPYQRAAKTSLRSSSGDQNYTLTTPPVKFTTVVIYSTQTRKPYATAMLSTTAGPPIYY